MLRSLKTALLSAMIGLTALSAAPAQAEGIYLNFGKHGEARAGVYLGSDNGYTYRRHRDRDRDRDWNWDNDRDRHWGRDRNRGCSPDRALNKAERMGLRRARVADVDRHTITVSGRRHGDRIAVTFARAPGCPVWR